MSSPSQSFALAPDLLHAVRTHFDARVEAGEPELRDLVTTIKEALAVADRLLSPAAKSPGGSPPSLDELRSAFDTAIQGGQLNPQTRRVNGVQSSIDELAAMGAEPIEKRGGPLRYTEVIRSIDDSARLSGYVAASLRDVRPGLKAIDRLIDSIASAAPNTATLGNPSSQSEFDQAANTWKSLVEHVVESAQYFDGMRYEKGLESLQLSINPTFAQADSQEFHDNVVAAANSVLQKLESASLLTQNAIQSVERLRALGRVTVETLSASMPAMLDRDELVAITRPDFDEALDQARVFVNHVVTSGQSRRLLGVDINADALADLSPHETVPVTDALALKVLGDTMWAGMGTASPETQNLYSAVAADVWANATTTAPGLLPERLALPTVDHAAQL